MSTLRIRVGKDGVIHKARFKTYGCSPAIADCKSKRGLSAKVNAPLPAQQID